MFCFTRKDMVYWSKKKVWHIGTYTKSFSSLVQLVSEILISKVIQLKWEGPQLYIVQWLQIPRAMPMPRIPSILWGKRSKPFCKIFETPWQFSDESIFNLNVSFLGSLFVMCLLLAWLLGCCQWIAMHSVTNGHNFFNKITNGLFSYIYIVNPLMIVAHHTNCHTNCVMLSVCQVSHFLSDCRILSMWATTWHSAPTLPLST